MAATSLGPGEASCELEAEVRIPEIFNYSDSFHIPDS